MEGSTTYICKTCKVEMKKLDGMFNHGFKTHPLDTHFPLYLGELLDQPDMAGWGNLAKNLRLHSMQKRSNWTEKQHNDRNRSRRTITINKLFFFLKNYLLL